MNMATRLQLVTDGGLNMAGPNIALHERYYNFGYVALQRYKIKI